MNDAVIQCIYDEIAEYKHEIDEAQSKITGLRAELYRLKRKGVNVQPPSGAAKQKPVLAEPGIKPKLLLSEMPDFLRKQIEAEELGPDHEHMPEPD